jgi:hypothetical protein
MTERCGGIAEVRDTSGMRRTEIPHLVTHLPRFPVFPSRLPFAYGGWTGLVRSPRMLRGSTTL